MSSRPRVPLPVWGLLALVGLLGLGAGPGPVGAQGVAEPTLTPAQVEARLKEAETLSGLDATQKATLTDLLRQALAQIEAAGESAAVAARFRESVDSAPREVRAVRESLARPAGPAPTPQSLGVSAATPLPELEQRVARERTDLASAEARLSELEKTLQAEQGRPAAARQEQSEARLAADQLREELKAPSPPGELAGIAEARRTLLQARLRARTEEVNRLEQELASNAGRVDLLGARRDLADREVGRARERVAVLDGLLNQVRRATAEEAVAHAVEVERAAAEKHPAIRQLAEANARAGAELARLAAENEQVGAAREATAARLKQLEQDFQGARQRLEVGGLTEALGKVLIEQRNRLPDTRGRLLRLVQLGGPPDVDWQARYGEVGLSQVEVEAERRDLSDLPRAVEREMARMVDPGLPADAREPIQAEIARLLRDRQALLQQVATAQGAFLRQLGELEFDRERLARVVTDYRAFLDEHLLWIPSTRAVGGSTLPDAVAAAGWLLSPVNWAQVALVLEAVLFDRPVAAVLGTLALAGLLWARIPMRRRLEAGTRVIGKPTTDHIGVTFEALGYTLLLALPVPAGLWLTGRALRASPESADVAQSVGAALMLAAPFLLNATVLHRLCAAGGVGALHFRWPEPALRLVRRQVRLVVAAGLPLVLTAATLGPLASEADRNSLGRLAFAGLMVVWSVALQRILRPDGPLMRLYFREHPRGYLFRLRYLWYPATAGAPLVLAGLAAAGFYYSAGQLAVRLLDTFWMVSGAVVLHALVIRWLGVTRRRLAFELARERREAALAAQAAREGAGAAPEPAGPVVPEAPEVDLAAVDVQTRKLLRTVLLLAAPVGLWFIWADVLPALGILERVTLWHQTVVVEGAERLEPTTLAELALALVLALVAAAAARNLPGVIEVVLLRYSELEPGSRYAVGKGVQYTIAGLGIAVVLGTLGWSWSQIQWLVAALGVGLGFGLQEIVANFISGLIILFERPVRVGDTVTVGELSGTVSRIRIRATTITDWDRKEIIVPNKAFITERVVNWTLSDPITRVKIRVGVAYGSDTELAHRLILEAVRSVERVRADPPPQVFFMGFGESSLDFDVYAFASQLADRLPITHGIHCAVERTLRDHGIEIPFPKRDVYIRKAPDAGSPALA